LAALPGGAIDKPSFLRLCSKYLGGVPNGTATCWDSRIDVSANSPSLVRCDNSSRTDHILVCVDRVLDRNWLRWEAATLYDADQGPALH
jgi:hypothetical protein